MVNLGPDHSKCLYHQSLSLQLPLENTSPSSTVPSGLHISLTHWSWKAPGFFIFSFSSRMNPQAWHREFSTAWAWECILPNTQKETVRFVTSCINRDRRKCLVWISYANVNHTEEHVPSGWSLRSSADLIQVLSPDRWFCQTVDHLVKNFSHKTDFSKLLLTLSFLPERHKAESNKNQNVMLTNKIPFFTFLSLNHFHLLKMYPQFYLKDIDCDYQEKVTETFTGY